MREPTGTPTTTRTTRTEAGTLFVSLQIFGSVLLPLIVIVVLAHLLGRVTQIDYRPLARASFYLFNPCLAFVAMATTVVTPQLLGRLVLFKTVVYLLVAFLAYVLAGRLNLSMPARSALILAAASGNSGNLGLPVNEYAFGQAGLALAVICYVTDNITINSVGVYIAARGHTSVKQAVLQVFRNPAAYAVPLGLMVNWSGWTVPVPLMRSLEMMSRAAVPSMLVVLGLELAVLPLARRDWAGVGVASVLRLLVAPLLGLALAIPLGLTGLARQVGVLQVAMPTAVTASIIAARFETEPNLVAGSVMVSSLASLITITGLLTFMS